MNKSNTPTYEKIMIPLRLPPEIYSRMMDEVQRKKKEEQEKEAVTVDRMAFLTGVMQDREEDSQLKEFGREENLAELEKNLSKLILCVEMENWEKAENFMTAIKQLTDAAPQEVRTAALRLKMSVQKADYEKTITAYDTFRELL